MGRCGWLSAPRGLAALAALGLAGLLASCATAPPPPPETLARGDYAAVGQHLQALIAHEMQAHDVTGLSIAIVDDQQVVWAHGAGWADPVARLPATEHTVYRMGSISKLLTATAALQLVQQGRLALDAPIQQALPGFFIRSRYGRAPITPRQLMTHHAGLPRDVAQGMFGREVGSFRAMVEQLRDSDAAYPPGLLLSYSNVGVTVLGAAIEQLAGVPFETHLQRALLQPLGMTSASFETGVAATPAMARSCEAGQPVDEPALRDVPAGGLNASVLDIARYLMMVFADGRSGGQAVLEAGGVAEMLRPQNEAVPLDVGFRVGLGWMLSTLGSDTLVGGGPVAHHAGATIHFRSQLYALPLHKLGVIVAASSGSARGVVDTVAKRALALALQAKTGIHQPGPAPGFRPAAAPWPDAALQAYAGEYATPVGYVKVVFDGQRLKARLGGREFELVPGEDARLGLRYALLGFIALPLGDLDRVEVQRRRVAGRDLLVARLGGQEMLFGERLQRPGGPLPAGLAGDYEPVLGAGEHRLLDHVRVSADDGWLFAEAVLAGAKEPAARTPLRIVSDHEALALDLLADAGEVVRWRDEGGQRRASYGGYEFRPKVP
jgi:CubicO group peptidase (beta-lactamase class C family)